LSASGLRPGARRASTRRTTQLSGVSTAEFSLQIRSVAGQVSGSKTLAHGHAISCQSSQRLHKYRWRPYREKARFWPPIARQVRSEHWAFRAGGTHARHGQHQRRDELDRFVFLLGGGGERLFGP
jgi:hypothetical protein